MALDEKIIRLARQSAQDRQEQLARAAEANAKDLDRQNQITAQELAARRAQQDALILPPGISGPIRQIVRRPLKLRVYLEKSGPIFPKP